MLKQSSELEKKNNPPVSRTLTDTSDITVSPPVSPRASLQDYLQWMPSPFLQGSQKKLGSQESSDSDFSEYSFFSFNSGVNSFPLKPITIVESIDDDDSDSNTFFSCNSGCVDINSDIKKMDDESTTTTTITCAPAQRQTLLCQFFASTLTILKEIVYYLKKISYESLDPEIKSKITQEKYNEFLESLTNKPVIKLSYHILDIYIILELLFPGDDIKPLSGLKQKIEEFLLTREDYKKYDERGNSEYIDNYVDKCVQFCQMHIFLLTLFNKTEYKITY